MKFISLGRLKHYSFKEQFEELFELYKKLYVSHGLSIEDKKKLLSISILFSNQEDEVIRNLGYRIALVYSIKYKDYLPLYDIALNIGIMPIIALLNAVDVMPSCSSSFVETMNEAIIEEHKYCGLVRTEQQIYLSKFFENFSTKSLTVIAPTSYGKSELIIQTVEDFLDKNVCILVPSKSLLAQTRKRIFDGSSVERIISHPDMYSDLQGSQVFVLTQERCTRLLNKYPNLVFDIVVVDEAHNILDSDGRNILLASVLKIIEKRNSTTSFKFLTPFLNDARSLSLKKSNIKTKDFRVTEYVKSELLYLADFRDNNDHQYKMFYDQFFDRFIEVESLSSYTDYLVLNSSLKNVIYFNKPKNIQIFADEFSELLDPIFSEDIDDAISQISQYTHNEYLLLKCIRKGIVYHHGSMTDSLRHYVEYLYRTCDEIKYLICSSTLLEGINLPVEKIFLMDYKKGKRKLSPSQFKNLIGRVSRFSEVFSNVSEKNIQWLTPEVHIVGSKYLSQAANLEKFLRDSMSVAKKNHDNLENIMLEGFELKSQEDIDDYNAVKTRLENIEPGVFEDGEIKRVSTEIGARLLEANISEIDIFFQEEKMQFELMSFLEVNGKVFDSNILMSLIYSLFISRIEDENKYSNLVRLKNHKAQTFYAMFLDWKMENMPLGLMIGKFVKYWEEQPNDFLTFVGSWGDTIKDGGYRKQYTYMSLKNSTQKVNLAIVRIKEEEDFLDYIIFRFIDILYDLDAIEDDFYKRAKYGTTNQNLINMIQNGFSKSVANLILGEYSKFVTLNDFGEYIVSPLIHDEMRARSENFFIRDEVAQNVKKS